MALQMDPERRRKLMELAEWHREWQKNHGVDDVEFVPENADDYPDRRYPTPEQDREFMRRAREILGQDPDTGRYLEP
jgi:hypothetical protein